MSGFSQTVAYRYRITRVTSDSAAVMTEIRSAHRLRNALVEIERNRRKAVQDYWAQRGGYMERVEALRIAVAATAAMPKGPERKAAWAVVDKEREELRILERAAMSSAIDTEPARAKRKARTRELRAAAKERGEKITAKQIAAVLDEEPGCLTPRDSMRISIQREYERRGVKVSAKKMAERLREAGLVGPTEHIEAEARAAAYTAYKQSGITPGTRGIVADAHEHSLEKLGLREQGFVRWDGHGAFGVQIHGGVSVGKLYDCTNGMLQLERLPDATKMTAGSRRSGGRKHVVRVRIGTSADGRSPVFASFEAVLHRDLPPEARVMQAKVTYDRIGVHDHWHLIITAQIPVAQYRVQVPSTGHTCAVDIGWRSTDGTLRVGYAVGTDSRREEITLPVTKLRDSKYRDTRQRVEHSRSVHSIMSRNFCSEGSDTGQHGIVHVLADWLDVHRDDLPEWLRESTRDLRRWKSQPRLNALAERWASNRFDADADIFSMLDDWRRQWRHLFEWAERERMSALASRDRHYEQVAVDLAKRYDVIVVNAADLADMRKRKTAKQATPELVMVEDVKRAQAFDAAPGKLREQIKRFARKYGRSVIEIPFDSMKCFICGKRCEYDRAKHLTHRCEHCGQYWDQDENACRNALRERGGGAVGGDCESPQKPADISRNESDLSQTTR